MSTLKVQIARCPVVDELYNEAHEHTCRHGTLSHCTLCRQAMAASEWYQQLHLAADKSLRLQPYTWHVTVSYITGQTYCNPTALGPSHTCMCAHKISEKSVVTDLAGNQWLEKPDGSQQILHHRPGLHDPYLLPHQTVPASPSTQPNTPHPHTALATVAASAVS